MNNSFSNFSFIKPDSSSLVINAMDVVKDICTQVDNQIVKIIIFMLILFTINKIMLPPVWGIFRDFKGGMYKSVLEPVFRVYYNITDGLILMCLVYGVLVIYLIGLEPWHKVGVWSCVGVLTLSVLVNLIAYFKDGGYKGFWKRRRKDIKKLEELTNEN